MKFLRMIQAKAAQYRKQLYRLEWELWDWVEGILIHRTLKIYPKFREYPSYYTPERIEWEEYLRWLKEQIELGRPIHRGHPY